MGLSNNEKLVGADTPAAQVRSAFQNGEHEDEDGQDLEIFGVEDDNDGKGDGHFLVQDDIKRKQRVDFGDLDADAETEEHIPKPAVVAKDQVDASVPMPDADEQTEEQSPTPPPVAAARVGFLGRAMAVLSSFLPKKLQQQNPQIQAPQTEAPRPAPPVAARRGFWDSIKNVANTVRSALPKAPEMPRLANVVKAATFFGVVLGGAGAGTGVHWLMGKPVENSASSTQTTFQATPSMPQSNIQGGFGGSEAVEINENDASSVQNQSISQANETAADTQAENVTQIDLNAQYKFLKEELHGWDHDDWREKAVKGENLTTNRRTLAEILENLELQKRVLTAESDSPAKAKALARVDKLLRHWQGQVDRLEDLHKKGKTLPYLVTAPSDKPSSQVRVMTPLRPADSLEPAGQAASTQSYTWDPSVCKTAGSDNMGVCYVYPSDAKGLTPFTEAMLKTSHADPRATQQRRPGPDVHGVHEFDTPTPKLAPSAAARTSANTLSPEIRALIEGLTSPSTSSARWSGSPMDAPVRSLWAGSTAGPLGGNGFLNLS